MSFLTGLNDEIKCVIEALNTLDANATIDEWRLEPMRLGGVSLQVRWSTTERSNGARLLIPRETVEGEGFIAFLTDQLVSLIWRLDPPTGLPIPNTDPTTEEYQDAIRQLAEEWKSR